MMLLGLVRDSHSCQIQSVDGACLSLVTTEVCAARPVRRQTYGYLPGRRASLPFSRHQIVLLGDRDTWVLATCPESLPDGAPAGDTRPFANSSGLHLESSQSPATQNRKTEANLVENN